MVESGFKTGKLYFTGDQRLVLQNGELKSSKTLIDYYTRRETLQQNQIGPGISNEDFLGMNLLDFAKNFKIRQKILIRQETPETTVAITYPRSIEPPPRNSNKYFQYCKVEYLLYVPWQGIETLTKSSQFFIPEFEIFLRNSSHLLSSIHRASYDSHIIDESSALQSSYQYPSSYPDSDMIPIASVFGPNEINEDSIDNLLRNPEE